MSRTPDRDFRCFYPFELIVPHIPIPARGKDKKRTAAPWSNPEYPQHMFRLRNKKNNFQLRTLIWRPVRRSELLPRIQNCLPKFSQNALNQNIPKD